MNNQKETIQKTKRFQKLLPFLTPLLLFAAGILILVNAKLLNTVFLVCGCVLALVGFTELVVYFATAKYEKKPRIFMTGILLLALAALLILMPFFFDLLIPFSIGLAVLIRGIAGFVETVRIHLRDTKWIVALVFNLAIVVLGGIILFNVWSGLIYTLIGVLLVISGGLSLAEQILLAIVRRNSEKNQLTGRTE